ncbi:guanylate kinase [Meridianimarinicoccus aquatilis]|uniref:Guanylate kinase n=1 Tax=Meridianimarinicoccus aquatilis TaxID=2552766 RepID=A0A4R6B0I5_9RHOB|nr:guanylate kinase [Fluviibacterium aquatile]QIE42585.1 guanylate kinase [Rhodobacteraceae bacterium SC52]TDL87963.1 guanylate kinase [Fluviibacterium aquatile]
MAHRRGLLIMLSSPSGAGKSTLANRLRQWDPSIQFSVSATTRAARSGETNGVEYYFHSREEFTAMINEGAFLEHAEVFGNFYGSPKGPVLAALDEGEDVLFDIDWQGGQQVRNSLRAEDVVSVFVLPPSIAELEKRLTGRGQDTPEIIKGRMQRSRDEISHWAEYDYVLVNNDIDRAEAELRAIVTAERLKRSRQPGLIDRVRALNVEFEERT